MKKGLIRSVLKDAIGVAIIGLVTYKGFFFVIENFLYRNVAV